MFHLFFVFFYRLFLLLPAFFECVVGAWTHFVSIIESLWIWIQTNEIWPKCSKCPIVVFWSFSEQKGSFSSNDPQSTRRPKSLGEKVNNGISKSCHIQLQISIVSNLKRLLHIGTFEHWMHIAYRTDEMITDFVLRIGNNSLDSEQRSYMFYHDKKCTHIYRVWLAFCSHVSCSNEQKAREREKKQWKFMVTDNGWCAHTRIQQNLCDMRGCYFGIYGDSQKDGKRADIHNMCSMFSVHGHSSIVHCLMMFINLNLSLYLSGIWYLVRIFNLFPHSTANCKRIRYIGFVAMQFFTRKLLFISYVGCAVCRHWILNSSIVYLFQSKR